MILGAERAKEDRYSGMISNRARITFLFL